MMRLSFVRCKDEDCPPTWWTAYNGHEKAIGVCYSPVFGDHAVVLTSKPFTLMEEHKYAFAAAILQPSKERDFFFTVDGFEIDVQNHILEMALVQGE